MQKNRTRKNSGFTLIELMVVISIIGLLATVMMISINNVKIKGQDAKKVTDIHNLVNALELYHDTYGFYPPNEHDNSLGPPNTHLNRSDYSTVGSFIPELISKGLMSSNPSPIETLTYVDVQDYPSDHNGFLALAGYCQAFPGTQVYITFILQSTLQSNYTKCSPYSGTTYCICLQ